MPPPSQLSISTQAVNRLVKEEQSYRKELLEHEQNIQKLEADMRDGKQNDEDGNDSFMLEQYRRVKQQTLDVFAPLRAKMRDAVTTLEAHIESAEAAEGDLGSNPAAAATPAELKTAQDAVRKAKEALAKADGAPTQNGTN